MKLSHQKWMQLNNVIKEIYQKKLNDLYPYFLQVVANLMYFDKASFELGERKKDKIIYTETYSINMDERFLEPYADIFHIYDTMYWFLFGDSPAVFRESDFSTPSMNQLSKYSELWMEPQNIQYCLGTRTAFNGIFYGAINFYRSAESVDFTEEEEFILSVLNEHLAIRLYNSYPKGNPKTASLENAEVLSNQYNLTKQELKIFNLILKGFNNKKIAKELFISESTAKKHLSNIYLKTAVNNRADLVRLAMDFIYGSPEIDDKL